MNAAATGLLDFERRCGLLWRIQGRILHKSLRKISPLAVPIVLGIGREPVRGEAENAVSTEPADALIEEAFADNDRGKTEDPGRGQAG